MLTIPVNIVYITITIKIVVFINMRLSSKTEYAFKTLADLAINGRNGVTRIADIAKRQAIPAKFLEQILLILKSANIVGSQRGAKGGYFLALPPAKISLATIVYLTDDSALSTSAHANHSTSKSSYISPFQEVWTAINKQIKEQLEKETLQDMCNRIRELQNMKGSDYFI